LAKAPRLFHSFDSVKKVSPLKIAFLTRDVREHLKQYEKPEPYFATAPQALLAGFAEIPEIEVHVVCCAREPMRSPEKLAQNIYYHSCIVPKFAWGRMLYLGCIFTVRKLLARLRPDVAHGQGTENDCALTAAFSGYPNLITIHGNLRRIARLNHARPFSYLWTAAQYEKIAVRKTDGVVCISQHTAREVEGLARKTWLIPNAVDAAFFSIQRSPPPKPALVCVGTILPLKNQLALIHALDPVVRDRPFRLIFAGEPGPSDYSQAFIRAVKERPWCEVPGFLKRDALRTLLSRATALIHPSLEENCPMAILEAMAAGVPVLASKVGGIPDLMDASTGWLFDPENPAEIQRCVEDLLMNPTLAESLGSAARARAEIRHHPKQVARAHLQVYRELLNETGSRSNDS
jgi:glycosyltransferase involved in cell wall biosynthesis